VEEHFREYKLLENVLDAEGEYPLQQFYMVPWRWTYMAQHRRESDASVSKQMRLYQWYRFLVLDIAMHLLILFVVRVLYWRPALKAVFRWIAPACVVRNWRVVGPARSQLVMEHELFRHVEIELFVQRHRLRDTLKFLKNTLESFESQNVISDPEFRTKLSQANCLDDLERLRGSYCHHYPICIRKILPDDTLISMASNAVTDRVNGIDADDRPGRSDMEAWYSITLTNDDRGPSRKRFEEFAAFLSRSMNCLFDARPHWGKLCPLPAATLRKLYPAFKDFQMICDRVDKDGVFRNPWTKGLFHNAPENQANRD
jgi:hypothetical protein